MNIMDVMDTTEFCKKHCIMGYIKKDQFGRGILDCWFNSFIHRRVSKGQCWRQRGLPVVVTLPKKLSSL